MAKVNLNISMYKLDNKYYLYWKQYCIVFYMNSFLALPLVNNIIAYLASIIHTHTVPEPWCLKGFDHNTINLKQSYTSISWLTTSLCVTPKYFPKTLLTIELSLKVRTPKKNKNFLYIRLFNNPLYCVLLTLKL